MATIFGIPGKDISVTVGALTYRAYDVSIDKSGSEVSARAFEDADDEDAVIMINKVQAITIHFRNDITAAFEVDDIVSVVIAIGTNSQTINCKVTKVAFNGKVDGIADFILEVKKVPVVTP